MRFGIANTGIRKRHGGIAPPLGVSRNLGRAGERNNCGNISQEQGFRVLGVSRKAMFFSLPCYPQKYPQKWGMSTNPSELKRKLRKQKIRLAIGLADFCELLWKSLWCRGRDSNPHENSHYPLKIACLPVPPPRRRQGFYRIVLVMASVFSILADLRSKAVAATLSSPME